MIDRKAAMAALNPTAAIESRGPLLIPGPVVSTPELTMVVELARPRRRVGRVRLWIFMRLVRLAARVCRFSFELRE